MSIIALILYTLLICQLNSVNCSIISDIDYFNKVIESKKTDTLIIDLRDEKDYIESHIDSSINIDYNDNGLELIAYLRKNKVEKRKIYLICYSGKRASKMFNVLFNNGFTNLNYITFGYGEFVKEMGDAFSPSTGECNCKSD